MASSPPIFGRLFVAGLAWRIAALVGALAATLVVWAERGMGAALLTGALVAALLIASLWRYIQRTNHEVARFVEAMTYADFAASFGHRGEGLGFERMGESMNAAVARVRSERAAAADATRTLAALVDEVPTPLLSLDPEGGATLLNKAARRMFNAAPVVRAADLAAYGASFASQATDASPAERHSVQLMLDETPQTVALSIAEIRQPGGLPLRLLAVQPIQSELDRVEMAAWRDLVRVLTHEIMNSVTPIVSLARTAADAVAAVDSPDPRIADAREAVATVARRADGVMRFVQAYRQIGRAPPPRRRDLALAPLIAEIVRLAEADWAGAGVRIASRVDPPGLETYADPDLIAQVLLNLVKNAAEAAVGHAAAPEVRLLASRDRHGRAVVEIADNGPGVPAGSADEIFLPFFTTKPEGSGVGLSLARQIVLSHGGSLMLVSGCEGATFRLVL